MSRGDKEQGAAATTEAHSGTDPEQSRAAAQRFARWRHQNPVPARRRDKTELQNDSGLCDFCLSSGTSEKTRGGATVRSRTQASLTLRVRSAADHMGQFGFQAGGGGAVLAEVFHAARPHGDHTLQRRAGPQTLGLVDRQRRGVVNQEASVLHTKEKKRR